MELKINKVFIQIPVRLTFNRTAYGIENLLDACGSLLF